MITLSFYKEILLCLIQSCCVPCNILFYLWVNIFCLPLLVGHSSRVPPKRKKRIKKNETTQPAGTVHEMEQEISVFSNIQTLSVVYNKFIVMLYSMQYPFLLNK